MKLAIPDLISNSYLPALAAAELGYFQREGLDVSVELIFPVDRAYEALRDGEIDFVGGAAHAALAAFPQWRGVKLLGALTQGMYWFLVMRSELGIARGDLAALRGRRIGAAPWAELGLRRLLAASALDLVRDRIEIGPVPGATGPSIDFGLTAAEALASGKIDGFSANGMAAELALSSGTGTMVLDVRRGDGPPGCFDYTMPVLAATGPPHEATLIANIVRRDLPYYEAAITPASVAAINAFVRDVGVLVADVPYESSRPSSAISGTDAVQSC
jgi:NitT/TauT family transport system substrate-binding protein